MEHILYGLLYVKPIYAAAMRKEGWFITPGKLLQMLRTGECSKVCVDSELDSDEPKDEQPAIRLNLYGQVYDLTAFAPNHPGGALILERLAENNLPDATPLFESYHAIKDPLVMKKAIAPYATGKKAPQLYPFEENGFYHYLRRCVAEHLRKNRPAAFRRQDYLWSHVKAATAFSAWVACLVATVRAASSGGGIRGIASVIAWAIMAGLALISWGFIMMHDASHYAFTRSPRANEVATTFWNTVAYWQSDIWAIHHAIRHHSYTGTFGLDPDMDHAVPFIRKTPQAEADDYLGLHPVLQVLSMMVFPGMYFGQLILYFRHRTSGMMTEALGTFSMKKAAPWQWILYTWFPVWFLAIASARDGGVVVACVAASAYVLAANLAYSINILPDHDTRPSHIDEDELAKTGARGQKQDWGEVQVRGSANWSGRAWCELWGGINYQIEHHLFPSLHHSLLPEVAPIVQAACKKYDVPYTSFPSIATALSSVVTQLGAVANSAHA